MLRDLSAGKRKFFANFGMILLYAVVGTLIAIIAAGSLLYLLVSGQPSKHHA